FETMHISLLRGREIQDSDGQNSQRVAVIDQMMADRYWHGRDPIGRHFSTKDDPAHPIEVIGVARNDLEVAVLPSAGTVVSVPVSRFHEPVATLQVGSADVPEAPLPEIPGFIRSLEPAMPVFDVQPMTTALETFNGFLLFRFAATLAASLGILGLMLALVG